MNHVVEYAGSEGMVTTSVDIRRFQPPKPGDLVLIPDDAPYPYKNALSSGKYGRVDYVDAESGELHVCWGGASVFLTKSGVSISGGPFSHIKISQLRWDRVRMARFWNWGDNGSGAHQGVYFDLPRPVWELTLTDVGVTNESIG